jgi:hypothetical protein
MTGDPDQEAGDHQDRDRVHRAVIARLDDHVYSHDELDHERGGQPNQISAPAGPALATKKSRMLSGTT